MKKFLVLLGLPLLVALPPAAPASPVMTPPRLWVMDTDGTNQRELSESTSFGSRFSWSPDSSHLVYEAHPGLGVVDVAAGDERTIAPDGARSPDWSTTDEIAFEHQSAGAPTSALYGVRPDGSGLRVIADTPDFDGFPAWSPDGSQIAFVAGRREGVPAGIFVAQADGSNVQPVSTERSLYRPPVWSSDGSELLYVTFDRELYRGRADGSGEQLVSAPDETVHDADWSPDGARIVFYGRASDSADERLGLWVIENDDTRRFLHEGSWPDWNPSAKIAFAWRDDIRVVDPDTVGVPNLTATDAVESSPRWSPDASLIAYGRQPPPPAPEPDVRRSITLKARRHLVLRGTLSEERSSWGCLQKVPVRLQRLTSKRWRTIVRTRTGDYGFYRTKVRDRRGWYRAVAPKVERPGTGSIVTCRRAVATPVRHQH